MKKTTIERTLKPCPFCGGFARYSEDDRLKDAKATCRYYVECRDCNIRTPVASMQQVQKMWNRRIGEE